jgi:CheY-like chemotaxis protein
MNENEKIGGNTPDGTRVRRALLAHMRHELRTPLNAILGYSEMLLEDAGEEGRPAFLADLSKIHASGMDLIALINDILDPAKIEAGTLDIDAAGEMIRHQLRTPLDSIIGYSEMLLEEAESQGLRECAADLGHIRTAGLKLLALIEEIIHFSSFAAMADSLSPQAEAASSMIQSIFTPPHSTRDESAKAAQIEPGSLLVVDDNEINRDILSRYLERRGHWVSAAASGREALSLVESRTFDLILLDIMMPDLNGFQVLQQLKSDAKNAEVPVIFISALDDALGKVQAFRTGGVDYVTKPFQAEEVIARVENQLKLSRLQMDLARQNRELVRKNEQLIQAHKRIALVFSALAESLPGTTLDGKYLFGERIGTGGFGTVYRGTHLGLNLPVAIKVFRPASGNDTPDALERFRREGISARRIKHPNAVEILDNGISSTGIAYLVMELLEGHTLADEMQSKRTFTPQRTTGILVPICEALAEVHAADIVHRDIKPENIYLHSSPHGEVAKLLDFGISKMLGTTDDQTLDNTTRTSQILGTPAYMAPERLSNKSYDGRADVYSLGVISYRMLCGNPPFRAEREGFYAMAIMHLTAEPKPLRHFDPGIPECLDTLVRKALVKDPELRPTAREFAALLRAAEASLSC